MEMQSRKSQFVKLKNYIEYLPKTENIPACDCIVYQGHEVVFRHMAGFSDAEKTKPVSKSDRYMLYSASKILTVTAVMQLVERGLLKLEDELYRYLPEFEYMYVGERLAKTKITIEHLLTMRAGFDYDHTRPQIQEVLKKNPKADTEELVSAMAKIPLLFEPGTHFCYSFCHDILARVIEVISGKKYSVYMEENIFVPLGMKYSSYSIEHNRPWLSQQYRSDSITKKTVPIENENWLVFTSHYESGGAGLVSTVDDYGKFIDAMCNYGVSKKGVRIISEESIDMMRTNRMDDICQEDFLLCNKPGYGYGLGVRTLIEKENSGAKSPLGEFGWDGAAGAYVMIDVENRIGIFYAQQVTVRDVANIIHTKIRNMVYEELGC